MAARAVTLGFGCSAAAFAVARRAGPVIVTREARKRPDGGCPERKASSGEPCGSEVAIVAQPKLVVARGTWGHTEGSGRQACFGVGMLTVGTFTMFSALRSRVRGVKGVHAAARRIGAGRTQLAAAAPGGPAPANAVVEKEDSKETFRALCTTLLRECGRAEDIVEAGEDGETSDGRLTFNQFKNLMVKLKVKCDDEEATELFSMLDEDGDGTVDLREMKNKLRSSGVITEMYNEGIQNALITLVPTLALAGFFAVTKGRAAAFDFVAGYVVEDSLSVDNLFVFLVIFKYFKVPPNLQKKCLDLGIYGAVVLRALFIFLGLAVINSFKPVLLIFAAVLLYASYTALFGAEEEEDDEEDEGPPEVIKEIVSAFPTTEDFEGDKLFVENPAGGYLATPLALCIISIELSDILFAVDSVPAIFAVTEDPAIVFTSNIAAILGLRSLYQILSIAVQDLIYLEKAAAVILGFVGVKLVGEVVGFEISSGISLVVIIAVLGIAISLSLLEENAKTEPPAVKKRTALEKLAEAAKKLLKL